MSDRQGLTPVAGNVSRTPEPEIPVLDLVSPRRQLEEALVAAFRKALVSATFVGANEVASFEREFPDYFRAPACAKISQKTRNRCAAFRACERIRTTLSNV